MASHVYHSTLIDRSSATLSPINKYVSLLWIFYNVKSWYKIVDLACLISSIPLSGPDSSADMTAQTTRPPSCEVIKCPYLKD